MTSDIGEYDGHDALEDIEGLVGEHLAEGFDPFVDRFNLEPRQEVDLDSIAKEFPLHPLDESRQTLQVPWKDIDQIEGLRYRGRQHHQNDKRRDADEEEIDQPDSDGALHAGDMHERANRMDDQRSDQVGQEQDEEQIPGKVPHAPKRIHKKDDEGKREDNQGCSEPKPLHRHYRYFTPGSNR